MDSGASFIRLAMEAESSCTLSAVLVQCPMRSGLGNAAVAVFSWHNLALNADTLPKPGLEQGAIVGVARDGRPM